MSTSIEFIHITDSHLLDHRHEKMYGINTFDSLDRVWQESTQQYPDAEFILHTGDVTQHGSRSAYQQFDQLVKNSHVPVYSIPGNHDDPRQLRKLIPSSPDESLSIVNYGAISLVMINSRVEGQHGGRISTQQLQQLSRHLQHQAEDAFNIIVIHHPPVLVNSRWLDALGLENPQQLIELLNQHNRPCLIVCGHVHQPVDQQMGQIRLLASPATCHQFSANSDEYLRDASVCGYRLIRISSEHQIHTRVHYLPLGEKMDQEIA